MFSTDLYMKAYTLPKHAYYMPRKSYPSSFTNPNDLKKSTFNLHAVKESGGVMV